MNPYEKEADIEFRGEYYVTASRFIGIRKQLEAENARLKEELERERLRLAGCGVAALGYFEGCNEEYRSASLDDVLRLREQLAAAQADAERYRFLRRTRVVVPDEEIDAAIAAEKDRNAP